MKEKNLKKIWLLSIFIILALFLIFLLKNNNDTADNDSLEKIKYTIVSDYNRFYTVNSCVYRYLTYLQSKDTKSLIKILDEEFIVENQITKNNILNFLTIYEGNLNFNSRKMFEEKINENITKYYVYGYVEIDVMDSFPERNDAYYIVVLDSKNKIFSIQPYNGEIFK